MRIEALVSLRGIPAGGRTPAGGFATVDDVQGRALVRLGYAREIPEGDEPVPAPVAPAPVPPPPPAPAAEPVEAFAPADEQFAEAKAVDAEREADMIEIFELLDADDFVQTGNRAGRPKVKAVEEALGYNVTMAEVDAAFAKWQASRD